MLHVQINAYSPGSITKRTYYIFIDTVKMIQLIISFNLFTSFQLCSFNPVAAITRVVLLTLVDASGRFFPVTLTSLNSSGLFSAGLAAT